MADGALEAIEIDMVQGCVGVPHDSEDTCTKKLTKLSE